MLTDQAGLYTADPRKDSNAEKIDVVSQIDKKIFDLAGGAGTKGGTGGMITKLQAAQVATRSGVTSISGTG
jgi:glutamate 5-kinase